MEITQVAFKDLIYTYFSYGLTVVFIYLSYSLIIKEFSYKWANIY